MNILFSNISAVLEYAEIRGRINKNEFSVTTFEDLYQDPSATVHVQNLYKIFDSVLSKFNDELIGIRIGEFSNLKALGLIYQISLGTTSVVEAMHYLQSHITNTFPLININVASQSGNVLITLSIPNNEAAANRLILEYVLTIISKELNLMIGYDSNARKTSPFHSVTYPEDWFGGETYSISFEEAVLNEGLHDKSRYHLDLLIPQYLNLIANLKSKDTFSDQVKMTILHLADPHLPALETLASTFYLTPRTLQRRLKAENTSYRKLMEEQKKVIADLLLRHKKFSVADVGYLLGYSEPAAFIHSFQKWYGLSPEKLRKSQVV